MKTYVTPAIEEIKFATEVIADQEGGEGTYGSEGGSDSNI